MRVVYSFSPADNKRRTTSSLNRCSSEGKERQDVEQCQTLASIEEHMTNNKPAEGA